MSEPTIDDLVEAILDGDQAALASAISRIENREPGYRELVTALHPHAGGAAVIGVTGSPGVGKSTLVDKLAAVYRGAGKTVGVIAVDPSSPYSGGAVLGDRIRMASTAGDEGVFFRSMSTRGSLGGVSAATLEAVTALDAFGMDVVIVETVGAGQNEVDVVRTTDTVVVILPPSSGDDVQLLKAGILEIGDVFVVNKVDLPGAETTVSRVRAMLERRERADGDWDPPIVETIATDGTGVEELVTVLERRAEWLDAGTNRAERSRRRIEAELKRILQNDLAELAAGEIARRGGFDALVDRVAAEEADPYSLVAELLEPFESVGSRDNG